MLSIFRVPNQGRREKADLGGVWYDHQGQDDPSSGAFRMLRSVSALLGYHKFWKWHFTVRVGWKRRERDLEGQPAFGNSDLSSANWRNQTSFGQWPSYPCLSELQQILGFWKRVQTYIHYFYDHLSGSLWTSGCLHSSSGTCCLILMLSWMLWMRYLLQGQLKAIPPALGLL